MVARGSELAQVLEVIGYAPHEHLSVGQQSPGQAFRGGRMAVRDLLLWDVPQDRNVWVGLVAIPGGSGRGTAQDARRIPALWADLDVKPGGLPSWDAARGVIADLSAMLGARPVYTVATGHGVQPVWAVDRDDSADVERVTAALARFGALVQTVARAHGGDADSVFDAARVLRVPGSVNWKDPAAPVKATLTLDSGHALTLAEISEALDAYGVEAASPGGATVVESHPGESWRWAGETCPYVAKMIGGWAGETPGARHPWLVGCCVRLHVAHRLGCLSHEGFDRAERMLAARMDKLRAHDGLRPGEVAEAMVFARALVEGMSDERCSRELGGHRHDVAAGETRTMALAARLVDERLAGRFLWATNRVGWHRWDGRRWARCEEDEVVQAAHGWVTDWLRDLTQSTAGPRQIEAAAKYRDLGNLLALVRSARTYPALRCDPATMDQQPGLLNCGNGVVDLRTGQLRPHDPALLFTLLTDVAFDAMATHPDWDKARRAFADADTEAWVRLHLGAALTGTPGREDVLALHHGQGANGKSSILDACRQAFGEFGGMLNDRVLVGGSSDHQTIFMDLRGRRLMLLEELPEGHTLPIDRIKKVVDTPTITARGIGQDPTTFTATHSLVVTTNYLPTVRETDHGTWRRLLMVDYPHTFNGADRDRGLRSRCVHGVEQQRAVLAWLVQGAQEWYAGGQAVTAKVPAGIAASTEAWRGDADPLGEFLAGFELTGDPGDVVTLESMATEFNTRLFAMGERDWSQRLFRQRLNSHRWAQDPRLSVLRLRVDGRQVRAFRGLRRGAPE